MPPPTTTPPSPASPPERVQRSDARRNRRRVIMGARTCMARDGLDAQMEDIARCAGVGVGTVYRHFSTKEDLVEALAADRFQRLEELGHDALAQDDPWDSFEQFIRACARIQTEDRALCEVLTSRPEIMARAAASVGMLDLTARLLKRAQQAGVVRTDAHPRDVAMIMCALAGTGRNPDSDPDRYIGIVLDGLRAGSKHTRLPPVSDA